MKHAIITGGARSVGFEVAKQLLAQGISVSIIDIDGDALSSAPTRLDGVETYTADVSKVAELEDALSKIIKRHPHITYLINTPAANPHLPFDEMSFDQIKEVVDVSLMSYVFAIKTCWDSFEEGGSIINISSVHGFTTYKGNSMYAAAKAAVESLTRALAAELRSKNVRINAIAPGGFTSEWYQAHNPNWKEKLERGQIFTPEDMANIVMFLLSDKSRAINGETIIADGGVFTVRSRSSDW